MKTLTVLGLAAALLIATACAPAASTPPAGRLTLVLTAGPVCPVEQDPPDPACADRPVAGEVVALVSGGLEVARGTSDAAGRITFALPEGRYTVRPVDDGTFPTPPAEIVVDVGAEPVELSLLYDTGIR
jgi:hypothetical protein